MSDTATARRTLMPGPDHPFTIARNPKRVVVTAGDRVIADTRDALTLQEANYPAVQYIPRGDADLTALERTAHHSWCPYKGEASYFSILGLDRGENAVWTYEEPHDAVADIREHLAFYPDRVTIEQRDD
ncbi:MAG: DUF427 domain-containing protein [Sphingomonas sp.]|uniref:DUF427 domain-containing protein n=1 Tax=Sphingomonas sp. TaxID=28214 RepID=UPI003F809983